MVGRNVDYRWRKITESDVGQEVQQRARDCIANHVVSLSILDACRQSTAHDDAYCVYTSLSHIARHPTRGPDWRRRSRSFRRHRRPHLATVRGTSSALDVPARRSNRSTPAPFDQQPSATAVTWLSTPRLRYTLMLFYLPNLERLMWPTLPATSAAESNPMTIPYAIVKCMQNYR